MQLLDLEVAMPIMVTGAADPGLSGAAGHDVIGIAATGSGKTLAFGLPALAHTRAQLAAKVADGERPAQGATFASLCSCSVADFLLL